MTNPGIRDLFNGLGRHPVFQAAVQQLRTAPASLSGLTPTAKAAYLVCLLQLTDRPLIVVTDNPQGAENLAENVDTFAGLLLSGRDHPRPWLLPALDSLPWQGLVPHAEITEQRAIGLWRMASGRAPITILPVTSALLRLAPAGYYRQLALTLKVNDEIPREDLILHLSKIGYQRRDPVEMVGEYSVRGGILDVFSAESQQPVRIEFYGDLIESIRRFEPESQRSVLKVDSCLLLPLSEGREEEAPERSSTVFSLVESPLVVWDEPEQIRSVAAKFQDRLETSEPHPGDAAKVFHPARGTARLGATQLAQPEGVGP